MVSFLSDLRQFFLKSKKNNVAMNRPFRIAWAFMSVANPKLAAPR